MHLLILEDRPDERELITRRLRRYFGEIQLTEVSKAEDLHQALEQGAIDLVLTDYALYWTDGLQVLRQVRARFPGLPVVMFTESGNEEIAVEGMRAGLSDYLLKEHLDRLPAAVEASLERARLQRELDRSLREMWQSHQELEARVQERTAELARVNETLRLTAEEYSILFNATSDGVWIHNLKGEILEVNDAYCRMSGYSRDEIVRMPVSTLEAVETAAEVAAHIKRVMEMGGHDRFESRHRRKDGSVFDVDLTALYFEKDGGRIAIFVRDITERKRVQEVLTAAHIEAVNQRNRLAAVMEALPVGVAIVDLQGGNLHTNAAYEQIWGNPRPPARDVSDYVAYQAWWADTGEPLRPEEWASARAVQHGETIIGQEVQIQCFDGTRAWVLNSAAPIRDGEGNVVGSAVAVQDITPLKEAEQALQEALSKEEEAHLENVRLYEQARQDAETKAALLREVNHRVKNNLAAIIGLLYAQLGRPRAGGQPDYQATIRELTHRIRGLSIVHGMLSQSEWAPLRLHELAEKIVESTLPFAPARLVAVEISPSEVSVSPDQAHALALVINELALNVRKHALRGGVPLQVSIWTGLEQERVLLIFRDNGPGYPEEIVLGQQVGVGLSLLQNLVRQNLRGQMVLRNEGGAVIEIRFPLAGPGRFLTP